MALTERQVRRDHYFMSIARAVREAANCLGSQVGAVLVVDDHIISTGYNGRRGGSPTAVTAAACAAATAPCTPPATTPR